MLKGLPASGKSFYAKSLVKDNPWKRKRVNNDDLRASLDMGRFSKINESMIDTLRHFIITESLSKGFSVVIDNTNFHTRHEEELKVLAKVYKARFEVKFFDTPLDVCIERDSKRENQVGSRVIIDMYNKYLKKEQTRVEIDSNLPNCIIVDIDWTIADNGDRNPYDQEKVSEDKPILETIRVLRSLNVTQKDLHFIITTGRMDKDNVREDTMKWLMNNWVPNSFLLMRKNEDTRKDSIVKEEMYNEYIKGKYNVLCVFDDRKQVVEKRRELGLFVFDCNQSGIDF